ncbi:glycosyltransferase family 2 protein [Sphingomonas arantia]|uniref:Glycosyltransferase family 2 protein n=1 Tax=Sphingomonas arantia TaxID=1460676 RepID=A0ABW4TZ72_9SPHN
MSIHPAVSICIPTYRRPATLVRAVASALDQDYPNITVVVSDDEPAPNPTTRLLEQRFGGERRLRIVRGPGEAGFVANTNRALRAAPGEWLKLLHDDDVLARDCVTTLMAGARACPEARLLRCRVDRYVGNRLVTPFHPGNRPLFASIPQSQAAAAAYTLQDVGETIPTAQCVHRSAIEAGILFETVDMMPTMAESCWNARLYDFAPVLIVNRALAQWRQGEQETMSSAILLDDLDREFIAYRAYAYHYVRDKTTVPPLGVAQDFIRLLRALARLKRGHLAAFARHVLATRHPGALPLVLRHLLGMPSRKYRIAPLPVSADPVGAEVIAIRATGYSANDREPRHGPLDGIRLGPETAAPLLFG